MLRKRTVIVLGAGASVPYAFPSGEELLRQARRLTVNSLTYQADPYDRDTPSPSCIEL